MTWIKHDLRTKDGLNISVVFDPDNATKEPIAVRISDLEGGPVGWALTDEVRAQFGKMAVGHWHRERARRTSP